MLWVIALTAFAFVKVVYIYVYWVFYINGRRVSGILDCVSSTASGILDCASRPWCSGLVVKC